MRVCWCCASVWRFNIIMNIGMNAAGRAGFVTPMLIGYIDRTFAMEKDCLSMVLTFLLSIAGYLIYGFFLVVILLTVNFLSSLF